MKKLLLILCAAIASITMQASVVLPSPLENTTSKSGSYLIIASYNPDTQRMSNFINSFQLTLLENNPATRVFVEDMGCKNFQTEAHLWGGQLKAILEKHDSDNILSVVFLGQEAWATFLSLVSNDPSVAESYKNIPVFSAFASENGIDIPEDSLDRSWQPKAVSTSERVKVINAAGGFLNSYDISKNIGLIKTFFPAVSTIALITDNTYGGASIKALVEEESSLYPEISFRYIDGRILSEEEVKRSIANLPENSVALIGTWRVNKEGQYFLGSSLQELFSQSKKLPVFSLTGAGIGSIAIGGFVPAYNADAKQIVSQIYSFYKGERSAVRFIINEGEYSFDKRRLDEMGVLNYQLPANSIIIDTEDPQIKQYRRFLILAIGAVMVLIFFVITFAWLYNKNRKLRQTLEKNEKDILEAKERAEEGDRLKSAFLANMSHEIRTPLNAIVGFSQLMSDVNCTEEDRTSYSEVITQNSDMLLTLISDILDISKMDTGKFELDYKEINLRDLCERIFATTNHLRKSTVEYICIPDTQEVIIKTDIHRLSQVLINLITNANKFTDKGSITMAYSVDRDKGHVMFCVSDTGTGIPQEKHIRLFERFEKLDEYTQGAGLGLAISKQIVSRLGGKIWIDPTYTDGAKFCFTHPI